MCLEWLGFGRRGIREDSWASEYQRKNYGGENPGGGPFAWAQSHGVTDHRGCMRNCFDSLLKNILILFNLVFSITGIALIGLGTYAKIHADNYFNFLGDQYVNTPIIVICVGIVIFVIAFFGCSGALQKNKCMLNTYATFLIIIFLAEIGAAIAIYNFKGDLKDVVTKNMKNGMNNYNKTGYEGVTKSWDLIQQDLKCCGVDSPQDWQNTTVVKVPNSCCQGEGVKGCGANNDDKKFKIGCLERFENQFRSHIAIVGGVAIGVCVIQLFGIVFACCIMGTMEE